MDSIDRRLEGRVALVTGGGRGIGKAIAIAFARAGASVAVTARSEAELNATARTIRAAGGRCLAVAGDVTSPADVDRVVLGAAAELGPIDVLVNNAGAVGEFATPWASDPDVWWRTMEVNVRGPMLFTRAVLPAMVARAQGRVINIGSYVGIRPTPDNVAYATSKAALARYTDSLAAAVSGDEISVFVVSPGLVRTEMAEQIPGVQEFPEEAWVPVESVSAYVLRLACGDADVLTGRCLHVAADDLDELLASEGAIREQGLYQLRLLTRDGPAD